MHIWIHIINIIHLELRKKYNLICTSRKKRTEKKISGCIYGSALRLAAVPEDLHSLSYPYGDRQVFITAVPGDLKFPSNFLEHLQ